jgi:hypothetical protein
MEKIALDVLHEVELYSNTELDEFDAQLFLINKNKIQFAFDLTRVKKNESIFTFKIPKSLESFLRDPVKYKVYVYLDNARFLADDGEMKIVSQEDFSGTKLLNPEEDKKKDVKFTAKIKKDEKDETPKETPKPKDTKKDSKKDKEEPQSKKSEVKENKEIEIDEVLSQHSKINEHITNKKNSKSLRDYAERIERNKKLSENKNELNEKLKKILSDFTSKS